MDLKKSWLYLAFLVICVKSQRRYSNQDTTFSHVNGLRRQISLQTPPYVSNATRPCPCSDVLLCQRMTSIPQNEVYVFSVNNQTWRSYNWTKITTFVEFGYYDDELLCHAHSHGARLIQIAGFDKKMLKNQTAWQGWIDKNIKLMQYYFLDGFNIDFEEAIPHHEVGLIHALTHLMGNLSAAVKKLWPSAHVTFDTPYRPGCQYNRCFDYKGLSQHLDYLFVMDYDENGSKLAWANSPYNKTKYGMNKFMDIGIPSSKLILGVPWYGYVYPCRELNQTTQVCHHKKGHQSKYRDIVKDLAQSYTGRMWDPVALSPYFDLKDTKGKVYQVWYDDPESLKLKYDLAQTLGLKGVGMWTADALDYTDPKQVQSMWAALP